MIERDRLVTALAEVSHTTWMRQAKRRAAGEDQAPPPDPDDPTPTLHDRERAQDIVSKLEELGIYP